MVRYGSTVFAFPYTNDHPPAHVHGYADGGVVIVHLLKNGRVQISKRPIPIRHAKENTVRKILDTAQESFDELKKLWEQYHGSSDKQETHRRGKKAVGKRDAKRGGRNRRPLPSRS